jgi:hypothetical protein
VCGAGRKKYKLRDNEFFQSISATTRMWLLHTSKNTSSLSQVQQGGLMNLLFKKIVHPQDSVLQFVTHYVYIMDIRAEKENKQRCKGEISDPKIWGGILLRRKHHNSVAEVFGKFQELLHDSTRFKIGGVTADEQGWSIQFVHPNFAIVHTIAVNKDATTYTCLCNMFDCDGLLCPHILKVFRNRSVDTIPEKYLLRRWSKEATIRIPKHLSGAEPAFGVPTTNKLRYNALCQKMNSLAVETCLGPEKYTVASAGIDQLFETIRKTRGSSANQQDEV